ncbi:MAG: hypothetical protein KC442_11625 [Thermomicrobiales bacterium]|nr:hypothetical protein [Thermomicrobiales bacterium]
MSNRQRRRRQRQRRRQERRQGQWAPVVTTPPPTARNPTAPPVAIIDHAPERWGEHIRQALATIERILPEWYPELRYQREAAAPCRDLATQPRSVVICEAPATSVPGAWAVTEIARRDPIPQSKMILAAFANPNPTLIVHELHHALTREIEHTGWERMSPPFDPAKLRPL